MPKSPNRSRQILSTAMSTRRFSRSTPASIGHTSEALPPEVVQCLRNSRFLHLGTSFQDHPHVSLMNYTFIPAGDALPHEQDDCIIMTTSRDTKKFINICANPRVSILVHDWTTPRPSSSCPPTTAPSAITSFLQNINSLELSSISATLNGVATILPDPEFPDDAADFFIKKHLESNPPESRTYILKPDIAVVKVRISSVRIADLDDRVEKWKGAGESDTPSALTTNGALEEAAVED